MDYYINMKERETLETTSVLIDDRPGNASLPAHHATMETELVAPGEQPHSCDVITAQAGESPVRIPLCYDPTSHSKYCHRI